MADTANTTDNAKSVIQARLKEMDKTQAALAQHLKTTPAILSRTLGTPLVRQDSHWPAILDALGLEVVIQVKPGAVLQTKES